MGGPRRLSVETIELICAELRKGKYKHAAAAAVGIHRDTLNEWERRGKQARGKLLEGGKLNARERLLASAVTAFELAHDEGESWLIDQILEAAANPKSGGRWTAYMTILERSRAERWAKRSRLDHGNADGKPFQVSALDFAKLGPAERAALRDLLAKAAGGA